jgi:hypothetical protein
VRPSLPFFPSHRGYLIAAPSVFRSGVEEVISVTIFNVPKEVTVQAQLVAQGEVVAQTQGAILGKSLGAQLGRARREFLSQTEKVRPSLGTITRGHWSSAALVLGCRSGQSRDALSCGFGCGWDGDLVGIPCPLQTFC